MSDSDFQNIGGSGEAKATSDGQNSGLNNSDIGYDFSRSRSTCTDAEKAGLTEDEEMDDDYSAGCRAIEAMETQIETHKAAMDQLRVRIEAFAASLLENKGIESSAELDDLNSIYEDMERGYGVLVYHRDEWVQKFNNYWSL